MAVAVGTEGAVFKRTPMRLYVDLGFLITR
jgi:hypothetical protein